MAGLAAPHGKEYSEGSPSAGYFVGSSRPVAASAPRAERSGGSGKECAGPAGRALQPQHLLLALAVGATFLAYARTLGFDFVFDDRNQIVHNPFVQSWRFLPRYFTSHVWSYQSPQMLGNYY